MSIFPLNGHTAISLPMVAQERSHHFEKRFMSTETQKRTKKLVIFLRRQRKRYSLIQIRDVEAVIFPTLPLPHLSLPLPLPPTKNEKTTVDNFFNFCGSVACLLLHFIILRRQKPSFIAITLPTSLELIISNYSVFVFLRYQNSC